MNQIPEKAKEFIENRKAICPITFVNDQVKADPDLNSFFTLPYDRDVYVAGTVNNMIYNANTEDIPKDIYNKFLDSVVNMVFENRTEAVKSYLTMNCADFINTYLGNMFNIFYKLAMPPYNPNHPYQYDDDDEIVEVVPSEIMKDWYGLHRTNYDIKTVIEQTIEECGLATSEFKDLPQIYYYQLANNLYYRLLTIIDTDIKNMAASFNRTNKNFKALAKYVYGEKNGIVAKDLTPEFKYVFATSVIREYVESHLPGLYNGICQIFANAALMSYTGADPFLIRPTEQGPIQIPGSEQNKIEVLHE